MRIKLLLFGIVGAMIWGFTLLSPTPMGYFSSVAGISAALGVCAGCFSKGDNPLPQGVKLLLFAVMLSLASGFLLLSGRSDSLTGLAALGLLAGWVIALVGLAKKK